MADVARIGIELDVSQLRQGGAAAERELNRVAAAAKLSTQQTKELALALGLTGGSAQQSIVRVNDLGNALVRTQTASRATTQVFNQLRGGMASMAQAAIGQTVPGLTAITSALGTFAIGSPALVAALAGLAAVATAFRLITKDASESEKRINSLQDSLIKLTETQKLQDKILGLEDAQRGARSALARERRAGSPEDIRRAQKALDDINASLALAQSQMFGLVREELKEASKVAKDAAKEAEKAWIDAAEAAARKWQRFHQELKQSPQELMRLMRTVGETAASFGQSTATTVGINPALRERVGAAFGAANAGGFRGVAGSNQMSGRSVSDILGINPMAALTQTAVSSISSALGKLVSNLFDGASATERAAKEWHDSIDMLIRSIRSPSAELDAIARVQQQARGGQFSGQFAGGNFGSLQDLINALTGRIAGIQADPRTAGVPGHRVNAALEEYQKLLELATAEQERLNNAIRASNHAMQEDLTLRLLAAQGMDKEALALRQQIEVQQLAAQGANLATLELLALVHGLERLNAEAEERKRQQEEQRRKTEAGEDLQVRLLRAQGFNAEADAMRLALDQQREYQQAVLDGLDEATLAALKLVHAAESAAIAAAKAQEAQQASEDLAVRALRAEGRDREADILAFDLRQQRELDEARKAQRSAEFITELIRVHGLERETFLKGLEQVLGGFAGSGSRTQQEVVRSFTGASEATVLTQVHISRSSLSELKAIHFHVRRIDQKTSTSGSGTSSTTFDNVDAALGKRSRREQQIRGDATI